MMAPKDIIMPSYSARNISACGHMCARAFLQNGSAKHKSKHYGSLLCWTLSFAFANNRTGQLTTTDIAHSGRRGFSIGPGLADSRTPPGSTRMELWEDVISPPTNLDSRGKFLLAANLDIELRVVCDGRFPFLPSVSGKSLDAVVNEHQDRDWDFGMGWTTNDRGDSNVGGNIYESHSLSRFHGPRTTIWDRTTQQ